MITTPDDDRAGRPDSVLDEAIDAARAHAVDHDLEATDEQLCDLATGYLRGLVREHLRRARTEDESR
jgi:hypothetical protein